MSTMIPATAGWYASRRAHGEIETRRVVAFLLAEPQAPVVPVIIGDDGLVSQDPSWLLWSTDAAAPPVWVTEQLGDVDEWAPEAPQVPVYGAQAR